MLSKSGMKKWPHQYSSLQARDNNQVTREPNGCAKKKAISQSIKGESRLKSGVSSFEGYSSFACEL